MKNKFKFYKVLFAVAFSLSMFFTGVGTTEVSAKEIEYSNEFEYIADEGTIIDLPSVKNNDANFSINEHTRLAKIWIENNDKLLFAVNSTHHLDSMKLGVKLEGGKKSSGGIEPTDRKDYRNLEEYKITDTIYLGYKNSLEELDPVEGLNGNTKDSRWTVFIFKLEDIKQLDNFNIHIRGNGGGHDIIGILEDLPPFSEEIPWTPVNPPIEPEVPLTPIEPSTPIEPEVPLTPIEPSTPIEPEVPLTPIEPSTPIDPEVPLTPLEPSTPIEPEVPLTPIEPSTPIEPEVPLTPIKPSTPIEPEVPLTPLVPSTPIEPPTGPLVPTHPIGPEAPFVPIHPIVPNEPTVPMEPINPMEPDELPISPIEPNIPEGTEPPFDQQAPDDDLSEPLTPIEDSKIFEEETKKEEVITPKDPIKESKKDKKETTVPNTGISISSSASILVILVSTLFIILAGKRNKKILLNK